jgi:hypothetical protein
MSASKMMGIVPSRSQRAAIARATPDSLTMVRDFIRGNRLFIRFFEGIAPFHDAVAVETFNEIVSSLQT